MPPAVTRRFREPPRDLDRARRCTAVRIRERAHNARQHLALRPEQDGPEAHGHVTAEDLSGEVRLRGAAAVGEQAGVVGLRRRLRADSQTLAQSHRDLRCVQTVLERKAHGEIRRQAQCRHDLGRANALPANRWLVRHIATLVDSGESGAGRPLPSAPPCPLALPAGPSEPPILQTLRWLLRPISFLESCRRSFGDAFSVRFLGFQTPMVMLSDPEAIRALYSNRAHGLPPVRTIALQPILGPRSLLLLEGGDHLARRRLMLPPFHGERMRAYESTVRDAVEGDVRGGRRTSRSPSTHACSA